MPHSAGLRRSVAACMFRIWVWLSDRALERCERWQAKAYAWRDWGEQAEPQTRSQGDAQW